MRKINVLVMLAIFPLLVLALPNRQTSTDPGTQTPNFRDPFTLKLRTDKGHYYQEHFDKVPYVAENEVYLFAGESFGINVSTSRDEISLVTYQRDVGKSDVEFNFTQESKGGKTMMLLTIRNKLKRRLYLDALMTVPGEKETYKTSILPIEPGLSDFESWPHPIVQLVLRNFRFSEKPSNG
jgi:hypothetical protein